jgi:hypothetical protein
MFDETLLRSSPAVGVPFVDILEEQGILPGIKVGTGLQRIDGTDGETSTQGLDGLAEHCKRSDDFLPPAHAKISGQQLPKLSQIYLRTKKILYCIFFLQIILFLFLLEVFVLSLQVSLY